VVAAARYASLLDQSEAVLASLAESPEIQDAQMPECAEQMERVLLHADQYTTISIVGPDGYLACGALNPENPLYLGDRTYFTLATSLGRFSVGDFTLGRITGKPVVGFAFPMMEGGQVQNVVSSSLDLNTLGPGPDQGALPEGHTFTVLGRNRQVMVRLPRTGDFTQADSVGAMAGADFPQLPEGPDPVIVTATDLDGIERLFAVAALRDPSGDAQGFVAFGRNQAPLLDEVDAIVSFELRYLAIGGLGLLILAWVLGHFWLVRCPEAEEA
jgi:hypothetical protein